VLEELRYNLCQLRRDMKSAGAMAVLSCPSGASLMVAPEAPINPELQWIVVWGPQAGSSEKAHSTTVIKITG